MQKFQEPLAIVIAGKLQTVAGANVRVYLRGTATEASLFAGDGTTPLTQPLVTNIKGTFPFCAANGEYTLSFSGAGFTAFTYDIELFDQDDIIVTAANVSYGDRPVADKLAERPSAEDKGASGDGSTDDSAAFIAAYDEAPAGSVIHVGPGQFSPGTIANTKPVLWKCAGSLSADGTSPLSLPGLVETFFQKRKMLRQMQGGANDYAALNVQRSASYTGGTPGYVNTGIRSDVTVGAGATSFEWAILGAVANSANAGENVGVYGQGTKLTATTGMTWGGVFEGRDSSGAANPSAGLVGAEVDLFANGTDANSQRVVLDVVVGKADSGGSQCEVSHGVRLGPQNGDFSLGRAKRGYVAAIDTECAFDAKDCTYTAGGVAYRMGINHVFSLVATNNRTFGYTASGWQYFVSGVGKWAVQDDGTMKLTNDIHINDVKVITSRRTGFSNAMTGTADKANAYDTETITLIQLARRVKAIEDALRTHGLIGV